MTHSHRLGLAGFTVLVIVLGTPGCTGGTPKLQRFVTSFVPPAPRPAVPPDLAEPPQVEPPVLSDHGPLLLSRFAVMQAPRSQTDDRIQRAQVRFQSGRRLYNSGDLAGARDEFDRAVDILLNTPAEAADRFRVERKLEELVDQIYRFDLEGLGSGEVEEEAVFDKAPLDEIREMTFPVDPKLKGKVRLELPGMVSQLPLAVNDSVLSFINYFSSERGRRTLLGALRRSGRYRPMISRILDEEGVPQELIYLAQAESGFLPRAVSRKAATGMWQFVKFRGLEYGLKQTPYSDDRLDPEKATRAAARHLRDLYRQLGDWHLALAAYNCGPGCVDRAVQRTGYADYWELRNRGAIPKETSNYVPIVMATTIMIKNAKDYGLDDLTMDPPIEYDTLPLTATTHLALVADITDKPVSSLRELNPALLKNVAPAGYDMRLPKGSQNTVSAALAKVPSERRASWRMHRVDAGETLAGIAKQYRSTPSAVLAANRASTWAPVAGELVVIPAAPVAAKPVVAAAAKRPRATQAAGKRKPGAQKASSRKPVPKVTPRRAAGTRFPAAATAAAAR